MNTNHSEAVAEPGRISSVSKAIRILELFDPVREELSLAQISKLLGWPKSTLSNFLRTLEAEGYLSRTPSSQPSADSSPERGARGVCAFPMPSSMRGAFVHCGGESIPQSPSAPAPFTQGSLGVRAKKAFPS